MEQQPQWLAEAWAEHGIREVPGASSNPRIVRLFRDAGHAEVTNEATAWCAAFVGACLARAGLRPTGSLLARSYASWGRPLETARTGAIAVFSRTEDPALGHVGFVVGESVDRLMILGGNQNQAVTVAAMPRARLVALRWAAEPSTATDDPEESLFEIALAHVLEMEGGWSEDPYDPGGPTNRGLIISDLAAHQGRRVTSETYPGLKQELRTISDDVVREIYAVRYWRPASCPDFPAPLALFHFDAAVNHGLTGAARLLQRALDVHVDGVIGPITRAAAHRQATEAVLERYAELRRERYRRLPHFWRFGRGWLRRVDRTLAAAKKVSGRSGDGPARFPPTSNAKDRPMDNVDQQAEHARSAKWWGQSMTVWGALITAASTVLPLLGPALGLELTPDLVRQLGEQTITVAQAIGGLIGILMTIVGRSRASTRLERRPVTFQF